ncbi:hypothetical protein BDD12DRAFT_818368 [Trichophaea hybrida]|nr:hypothetical protein BDD12DRAFT_818368 [Trichophaea hybrida]
MIFPSYSLGGPRKQCERTCLSTSSQTLTRHPQNALYSSSNPLPSALHDDTSHHLLSLSSSRSHIPLLPIPNHYFHLVLVLILILILILFLALLIGHRQETPAIVRSSGTHFPFRLTSLSRGSNNNRLVVKFNLMYRHSIVHIFIFPHMHVISNNLTFQVSTDPFVSGDIVHVVDFEDAEYRAVCEHFCW